MPYTRTITSPSSSTSSSTSSPLRGRRPRVSAEHTLSRVRENQRRHRARRKDYIEELEQRLAKAERLLEEARREIAELKAGAATERRWKADDVVAADETTVQRNTRVEAPIEQERSRENNTEEAVWIESAAEQDTVPLNFQLDALLPPSALPTLPFLDPSLLDISTLQAPNPSGPPPCCTTDAHGTATQAQGLSPLDSDPDPECTSCALQPAPSLTESTTLCSQAYTLIAQQNFRGIDVDTIRMWLWQGYRRARARGEGCRVENGVLLRVLDFISN